ncbi:MAG: hypothetical protein F9K22_10155 [Bacteroidetes bacterium]|nr:MAG: hypothetical protein F9K22_10155 [Bacteroidota bacterium]
MLLSQKNTTLYDDQKLGGFSKGENTMLVTIAAVSYSRIGTESRGEMGGGMIRCRIQDAGYRISSTGCRDVLAGQEGVDC